MIYDIPKPDDPIRQGDIFFGVPRADFSLESLDILTPDGFPQTTSWDAIDGSTAEITTLVRMTSVTAIVATQDCDASRERDITLCEIRGVTDVIRQGEGTTSEKKWIDLITKQSRGNLKWFYLPPDPRVGFTNKMAVDFRVTLRIQRSDLEVLRHRRRCRLNEVSEAHFRERLGDFFRRYPYDEWYPFSPSEFQVYRERHPDAEPFEWQKVLEDQSKNPH